MTSAGYLTVFPGLSRDLSCSLGQPRGRMQARHAGSDLSNGGFGMGELYPVYCTTRSVTPASLS